MDGLKASFTLLSCISLTMDLAVLYPTYQREENSIPKRLAWPVAGPAELTWNTPSTRTAGGVWTKSHILAVERTFHVSWSKAAGVHLIGGHGVASNNAERLTEDGSVARTFPLKDLIV